MVLQLTVDDDLGPQVVHTIDWLVTQPLAAGESHLGQVGGHTPKVMASMTRLDEASSGAYTAGDLIANSTTAASVNPLVFDVSRPGATIQSGRITACRCLVTPVSGNLVITNLDFDLLLFRPVAGIPYLDNTYPADNTPVGLNATMMRELVAIFTFSNAAWRNAAGGLISGSFGYQEVTLASGRLLATYNLASIPGATTLLGLLQAKAAWNPGNIDHQFDIFLDVDPD